MATDTVSRVRQAAKLAVVLLVLAPLLVRLGFVSADLVPRVAPELLVQAAGLGLAVVAVALLVRQKRRSRGQSPSEGFRERAAKRPRERPDDREVEGSGEVYAPYAYNEQQRARREGERIRQRAEEIAEADREARR